jgi:hypothetical protein
LKNLGPGPEMVGNVALQIPMDSRAALFASHLRA